MYNESTDWPDEQLNECRGLVASFVVTTTWTINHWHQCHLLSLVCAENIPFIHIPFLPPHAHSTLQLTINDRLTILNVIVFVLLVHISFFHACHRFTATMISTSWFMSPQPPVKHVLVEIEHYIYYTVLIANARPTCLLMFGTESRAW